LWLVGLGLVLGLGAIRAGVFDMVITLPVDLDLVLVIIGGILVTTAVLGMSLQRAMERLRHASVAQARAEAFAEHRRFLLRLDHELKNPLTAIVAGVVNLSEGQISPEQKRVLDSMETQTHRLSRIVTDLRKLAEIETLPLEQNRIDVQALLEETVDLVQERADERTLRLILPDTPLPAIFGDHDLLLLALHNLLDNAFKFTRPNDRIEVRASVQDSLMQIEIADSGIGIPALEHSLIWEELFRGKSASGTLGSGVGLSLVQVIVRRHDGTILLSSAPGRGTTVSLQFPILTE
jgi:two-component system OmpR family sensor kinase